MAERELSFGEYLTQLREAKDVTLRELARKIGVSAPFLSDVEKNRRAPLTAERLEKVAAVLGLSEEEKASRHILGRLYGPIATTKEKTRNGRGYNKEL